MYIVRVEMNGFAEDGKEVTPRDICHALDALLNRYDHMVEVNGRIYYISGGMCDPLDEKVDITKK